MGSEVENILMAKQISPTPMRVMVLEYFLRQKSAKSLNDLEKVFGYSDRTTLYRTLKTFDEQGLIHEIKDSNEPAKYAICESECSTGTHYDRHIHFYCTTCRILLCLPEADLPEIKLPAGFELHEISFVARGTCDGCQKNAILLQQHIG